MSWYSDCSCCHLPFVRQRRYQRRCYFRKQYDGLRGNSR